VSRLLFAAYFLEAGLVLVVAPWKSEFLERNFFVAQLPAIENIVQNVFVRGAVSGVGAVTALAGLAELAGLFRLWKSRAHADPTMREGSERP
jgi:hypothetical protein